MSSYPNPTNERLILAAEEGDYDDVKALLRSGQVDRHYRDRRTEKTALDIVEKKFPKNQELLDILRYDPKSIPICLAAKHNDWKVLRALLEQGVSINQIHDSARATGFPDIYCPIIAAASSGHTNIVKNLLEYESDDVEDEKINVNMTNSEGRNALMIACLKRDEAMILLLLAHGGNRCLCDYGGLSPVQLLSVNIQYDKLIEEHKLTSRLVNVLNTDPAIIRIHDCVYDGNYDQMVALFRQGVSPVLPLRKAEEEELQMFPARKTVDRKFPVGATPLMVAAACAVPMNEAHRNILVKLLKSPEVLAAIDAQDEQYGFTALMCAASRNNEEVVLMLLKANANRDITNKDCMTAADVAAKEHFLDVAAIVYANPSKVLIHDACSAGQTKVVLALLKQGCPLDFADERPTYLSQTPLMAACSAGKETIVSLLFAQQAKTGKDLGLNKKDSLGRTALMRALLVGALEVSSLLLAARCNTSLSDASGFTAEDYASKHSSATYIQYLAQKVLHVN